MFLHLIRPPRPLPCAGGESPLTARPRRLLQRLASLSESALWLTCGLSEAAAQRPRGQRPLAAPTAAACPVNPPDSPPPASAWDVVLASAVPECGCQVSGVQAVGTTLTRELSHSGPDSLGRRLCTPMGLGSLGPPLPHSVTPRGGAEGVTGRNDQGDADGWVTGAPWRRRGPWGWPLASPRERGHVCLCSAGPGAPLARPWPCQRQPWSRWTCLPVTGSPPSTRMHHVSAASPASPARGQQLGPELGQAWGRGPGGEVSASASLSQVQVVPTLWGGAPCPTHPRVQPQRRQLCRLEWLHTGQGRGGGHHRATCYR